MIQGKLKQDQRFDVEGRAVTGFGTLRLRGEVVSVHEADKALVEPLGMLNRVGGRLKQAIPAKMKG